MNYFDFFAELTSEVLGSTEWPQYVNSDGYYPLFPALKSPHNRAIKIL